MIIKAKESAAGRPSPGRRRRVWRTQRGETRSYDFIFGTGAACSCTALLRTAQLQFASYPFDWLYGGTFVDRCRILANRFDRFIELQDLSYSYMERSISCTAYHNDFNGITFNHDFLKDVPIEKSYPAVREKYNRRIHRLLSGIESSSSVLIVYLETPDNETHAADAHLIEGYDLLKEAFPGIDIDILYICHSVRKTSDEEVSPHIRRIYFDYKDEKRPESSYAVDAKRLMPLMREYRLLHVSTWFRVKRLLLKICFECIPVRKWRKGLRRKFHI